MAFKITYLSGKKPRKKTASKLITSKKSYAMKPNGDRITVSTWDGTGKYGYSNKYIKNTPTNRAKILKLKGEPEFHNGKFIWM